MYPCTHVLWVFLYCGTSNYPDSFLGLQWYGLGRVRAPTIREKRLDRVGMRGEQMRAGEGGSVFRQTPSFPCYNQTSFVAWADASTMQIH